MTVTVRVAEARDVEDVARVHVETWHAAYPGRIPQARIDRMRVDEARLRQWRLMICEPPAGHRTWVAERDAQVVGFAGTCPATDDDAQGCAMLAAMYVAQAHWRSGVGHALMAVALDHLRSEGYAEAIVWTLANYPQGINFYESTGWTLDRSGTSGEGAEAFETVRLRQSL